MSKEPDNGLARSIAGKYAFVDTSSEEFAARKAEEIALEDRRMCDQPDCPNEPQTIMLHPNPSYGLPCVGLPAAPAAVRVARCKEHLHAEGHFTKDEYKSAYAVLTYFAKLEQEKLKVADRDMSMIREAGNLRERVYWFGELLNSIKYKGGVL